MATTNTANKALNVIGIGDAGWGPPTNDNVDILDKALGSFAEVGSNSGSYTLALADYQCMCLKSVAANFLANVTLVIPSGVKGQWVVINRNTGSNFELRIKNSADATFVSIPNGEIRTVYSDGTTVFRTDDQAILNLNTTTGGVFQTGDNTFSKRTITGTANQITVTDGNGVSGNPTIAAVIATQAEAEAGTNNTKLMTPLRVEQHMVDNALGWGQTWSYPSRSASTIYQNTTGRPIAVNVLGPVSGNMEVRNTVSGTWFSVGASSSVATISVSFIVPNGMYYRKDGGSFQEWAELR